jgi:hypothetical protein
MRDFPLTWPSGSRVGSATEFRDRGWITFDLSIGEMLSVVNDGSGPVAERWRAS